MDADSFVALMRSVAPTRESLEAAELDPAEIEDVLAVFACIPVPATARAHNNGPLVDLVTRFDCSRVSVRGFSFSHSHATEPEPMGLLVGCLEADAVRVLDDGIYMDDHAGSRARTLVARDQDAFLEAIGRIARAPFRERTEALQRECAAIAGVEVECPFWRALTR